jgi:regulator of RNase E activity RraA
MSGDWGLHAVESDRLDLDRTELAAHDLPAYARGVIPRAPSKDGPGKINVVVNIGAW